MNRVVDGTLESRDPQERDTERIELQRDAVVGAGLEGELGIRVLGEQRRERFVIGKRVIRVKYISLVNLIMDRLIVKELIQDELTPENLKKELADLLAKREDHSVDPAGRIARPCPRQARVGRRRQSNPTVL